VSHCREMGTGGLRHWSLRNETRRSTERPERQPARRVARFAYRGYRSRRPVAPADRSDAHKSLQSL